MLANCFTLLHNVSLIVNIYQEPLVIEKEIRPKSNKYRPTHIRLLMSQYNILCEQINSPCGETVSGYVRKIIGAHIDELAKKNLPEKAER